MWTVVSVPIQFMRYVFIKIITDLTHAETGLYAIHNMVVRQYIIVKNSVISESFLTFSFLVD